MKNFINLPVELTEQKRFFPVNEKKVPLIKEWSNPDNQKYYQDVKGLAGFDICGHGINDDYLVLDFDHVLTDTGEWVNDYAKSTFEWIMQSVHSFTELSISRHGLHIILKPTAGKFPTITNSTENTLYFEDKDPKKSPKLEIFYKTGGRYFLFTGNKYLCDSQAPITSGILADNLIELLLSTIKAKKKTVVENQTGQTDNQNGKSELKNGKSNSAKHYTTDSDFEKAKIEKALDFLDPSYLSYDDWLNVGKALKSVSDSYLTLWDSWSSRDIEKYNKDRDNECTYKWESFKGSGITIATLFKLAKDAGFDDKQFYKDWIQSHKPAQNFKSVDADHDDETQKAIEILKSITDWSLDNIYSKNILQAAGICYSFAVKDYEEFKTECSKHGIKVGSLDREIKRYAEQAREKRRLDNAKKVEEMAANSENIDKGKAIALINYSLERDSKGKVLQNTRNFDLVLENDPFLKKAVGYDNFNQRMTPLKNLPWQDKSVKNLEWTDSDDYGMQNYIDRNYNLRNEKIFKSDIDEYSKKHSFHPVRDFFNNLPEWDGTARAEKVFIDSLGVVDSEYAQKVSKHWLLGLIARVFHPGCKFDYCLVTKGVQGIGKSTILGRLAVNRDWFNDSLDSFEGKDAMEALRGKWIVELGEMAATRKSENEKIKAFISRQVDDYRKAYGDRNKSYPRQCLFAATTNSEEFLKDRTGGRRFLILVSEAKPDTIKERMAKFTKDYILQVWAEVYHIYKEMFKDGFDDSLLDIPAEVKKEAKDYQDKFTEGAALTGFVTEYLEKEFPTDWEEFNRKDRRDWIQGESAKIPSNTETKKRDLISAHEIAYEMLKIDDPKKSQATIREINEIMANLPEWRRVDSIKTTIKEYGRQRLVFERVGRKKINPFLND